MKRKNISYLGALAVALLTGLCVCGCDKYDELPPRNSGGSYDILPIVPETPTGDELTLWRAIKAEYNTAIGK